MLYMAMMERIKKIMCVVTRVANGFGPGCHHVELNVVEQKHITEECITENTRKMHY